MKNHTKITLAIIGILGAISLFNPSQKNDPDKNLITLRIGDTAIETSYENLGVSIDAETKQNFGMASLFPSTKSQKISIDKKILEASILNAFPFLKSPEEAAAQFFVTSDNQKPIYTFNLSKLTRQLAFSGKTLKNSTIEIDVLPQEELEILQKDLNQKTITLRVEGDDIAKSKWEISLSGPSWVLQNPNGVSLNEKILKDYLRNNIAPQVEKTVEDATIKAFIDEGKSVHVEADGVARDGILVPIKENIALIQQAVKDNNFDITLQTERTESYVYNETGLELGDLELLAVGRSNFAGSPEGRAFNIQKGLKEKMNNIIIPPGAEFSFNSFLGPVTNRAGWKNALGIFGGGSLKPTPGGGLCQVSTTVYRAALYAGLPFPSRRSHSLYVKYYKDYGEGLDATVFQGGQDLIFKNDTPSYLFMQAYDDGDDAYVKLYGTSDSRSVTLEGPYRTANVPQDEVDKHNYKPRKNEIAWHRTVAKLDGEVIEEQILSRYKSLPRQ